MKIILDRATAGVQFGRLFEPNFGEFDVERLVPTLFYLVVANGRNRGSKNVNDPTEIQRYVEALSQHPKVEGFDDTEGRQLLDKWLRASVIRTGRKGRSRSTEQIEFVLPVTFLCYKTGLPSEISRQRNVPAFLYRGFLKAFGEAGVGPVRERKVQDAFMSAFGRGVQIGEGPRYDGAYDEETQLDVQSLLALRYLEGFLPTPALVPGSSSSRGEEVPPDPALPRAASSLAKDVLLLLLGYADRLPPLALTRSLMAIINFELFVYTLKLAYATNSLVATSSLPVAMTEESVTSLPDIYVDFTRDRGGVSDQVSVGCVERDLEELRMFFRSVMYLRTLDRLIDDETANALNKTFRGAAYLQALLEHSDSPWVQVGSDAAIKKTLADTKAQSGEPEHSEIDAYFAGIRNLRATSLDKYVEVLVNAQKSEGVANYLKWFWSVGGLRKPFGLLSGNVRGRRNWRYTMGDDLLAALAQLFMVRDISTGDAPPLSEVRVRQKVPLREFLDFLHMRFGIIVDRPPSLNSDTESRQAGRENLDAFRRRLRQMGLMEELSDDFTAQYVRSPVAEDVRA